MMLVIFLLIRSVFTLVYDTVAFGVVAVYLKCTKGFLIKQSYLCIL